MQKKEKKVALDATISEKMCIFVDDLAESVCVQSADG